MIERLAPPKTSSIVSAAGAFVAGAAGLVVVGAAAPLVVLGSVGLFGLTYAGVQLATDGRTMADIHRARHLAEGRSQANEVRHHLARFARAGQSVIDDGVRNQVAVLSQNIDNLLHRVEHKTPIELSGAAMEFGWLPSATAAIEEIVAHQHDLQRARGVEVVDKLSTYLALRNQHVEAGLDALVQETISELDALVEILTIDQDVAALEIEFAADAAASQPTADGERPAGGTASGVAS